MRNLRGVLVLCLLLLSLIAQGQVACKAIFGTRWPHLTFRHDPETTLALEAISQSWRQKWYASSAKDRNQDYDQTKVIQARSHAESLLRQYLKSDPELVGASDLNIEDAVQRTLTWIVTNENQSVSNRAALEIGRSYLLLRNQGKTKKPDSWESTFKDAGFNYVKHGTTLEYLVQILEKMTLSPRPTDNHFSMGGDAKFVYVEIPNKEFQRQRPSLEEESTGPYSWNKFMSQSGAYILISPSAFDNTKWSHVNAFWEHGKYDKQFSFKTPIEIFSLLSFLKENYEHTRAREDERFREQFIPEWLFTEPIDLRKNDFRIIVHPDVKQSFKAKLKEAGVDQWVIDRIQ